MPAASHIAPYNNFVRRISVHTKGCVCVCVCTSISCWKQWKHKHYKIELAKYYPRNRESRIFYPGNIEVSNSIDFKIFNIVEWWNCHKVLFYSWFCWTWANLMHDSTENYIMFFSINFKIIDFNRVTSHFHEKTHFHHLNRSRYFWISRKNSRDSISSIIFGQLYNTQVVYLVDWLARWQAGRQLDLVCSLWLGLAWLTGLLSVMSVICVSRLCFSIRRQSLCTANAYSFVPPPKCMVYLHAVAPSSMNMVVKFPLLIGNRAHTHKRACRLMW